jgi:hypothetical protein
MALNLKGAAGGRFLERQQILQVRRRRGGRGGVGRRRRAKWTGEGSGQAELGELEVVRSGGEGGGGEELKNVANEVDSERDAKTRVLFL